MTNTPEDGKLGVLIDATGAIRGTVPLGTISEALGVVAPEHLQLVLDRVGELLGGTVTLRVPADQMPPSHSVTKLEVVDRFTIVDDEQPRAQARRFMDEVEVRRRLDAAAFTAAGIGDAAAQQRVRERIARDGAIHLDSVADAIRDGGWYVQIDAKGRVLGMIRLSLFASG